MPVYSIDLNVYRIYYIQCLNLLFLGRSRQEECYEGQNSGGRSTPPPLDPLTQLEIVKVLVYTMTVTPKIQITRSKIRLNLLVATAL